MYGLGLRLSPRNKIGYSPSVLFNAGEQGVWYDPSDMSSLYQDSAGTTPVTAVEQPVGLMLDKRFGLVRGAEIATGNNLSTASIPAYWAASTTKVGNVITTTGVGGVSFPVVAGKSYEVVVSGTNTVGFDFRIEGDTSGFLNGFGRAIKVAVATGTLVVRLSGAGSVTINSISIREIPGNHASQATAAARPVLSARKNLLVATEDFASASWVKSQSGTGVVPVVTANYGVDPLGGNTADRIQLDSGAAGNSQIAQSVPVVPVGSPSTYSVWIKSLAGNVAVTLFSQNTAPTVNVTGQWQRFEIPIASGTGVATDVRIAKRDMWGTTGTADLLVWGSQFEYGPTATRYQRVNTATDYDSAGFPLYLKFDGVDDGLVTGNIDFTATDKVTLFAGVRKESDAAFGTVVDLSTDPNTVNHTFAFGVSGTGADTTRRTFGTYARGTGPGVTAGVANHASLAAPFTAVVTGQINKAGSAAQTTNQASTRVNGDGSYSNTAAGDAALAGNFANLPLYIGRRGNATSALNGRLYGLIVRGAATVLSEIKLVEKYYDQKVQL